MKKVTIYADGACSQYPGGTKAGAWAAILIYEKDGKEHTKSLVGREYQSTNNRMEILATVRALEALKERCEVDLHSDSAYVVNCFKERWYEKWRMNGWRNSRNEPVKNKELWEILLKLNDAHQVNWIKVKGHDGNYWNEQCDQLANAECAKASKDSKA